MGLAKWDIENFLLNLFFYRFQRFYNINWNANLK